MAIHNHNNHNRVSILIVDDHEVVRNGIRSYLETLTEFNVVGEAASGEEALKLVSEYIPDIVLLDLIMPGLEGVETTRRIKTISPRTQVVVLTSYHEDVHIFPALKAGAISYILKDMKMEKVVNVLLYILTSSKLLRSGQSLITIFSNHRLFAEATLLLYYLERYRLAGMAIILINGSRRPQEVGLIFQVLMAKTMHRVQYSKILNSEEWYQLVLLVQVMQVM